MYEPFETHHEGKRIINPRWHDHELGLLLTQSELLARGWTKKQIREQIGEPDCYGRNPRGGSYVLLYKESRTRRAKLKLVGD